MNERDDRHGRPADFATDEPLPHGAIEPVDVAQVRADDALIAALGGRSDLQVDDPIDERLTGLLRSWRDDVQHEERLPLVDLGAATAALASAPRPRRRPQSPVGPWATAAAIFVIAFVGLGLAAKGAEPGDPLWNVTRVLYSDKAKSVEAAVTVQHKLDDADRAIRSGKIMEAAAALDEAKRQLSAITLEDGQQQLSARTEQLMAQITGPPPAGPVSPSASEITTPPLTSTAPTTTTVSTPPPPVSTVPTTQQPTTPTELPSSVLPTTEPATQGGPPGSSGNGGGASENSTAHKSKPANG